ncbi:PP2C family serine/threonine-protein phosphatase [Aspergillus foveolatus]|uniref:PP2C family serine/threonine-protein phosphatase n=1 Tax=Aspergillus foveolatus TaxID=210207 RepID=UPI003CCE1D37
MDSSNTVELHAAGGQSAQGARPDQEDEYIILTPGGSPNEIGDSIAFFAVFDGHGTGIVSNHAKEHIPLILFESDEFKSGNYQGAMQAAIDKEDELLLQGFREGQNFFATSGSTASLALVDMKKGVLVVGNIGDSHILMAERDPETGQVKSIERLTTSHKPESADEKARIEKAGGHVLSHHDISRIGSLNMSRALGDLQYKTPLISAAEVPKTEGQMFATAPDPQDMSAQDEVQAGTRRDDFITVEMSFRRIDLHKEKQYLLALTTDGVTNALDDGEIMNGIAQMFNTGSKADEVARKVVDQAAATEYADNATCVAVFLNGTEARLT